MINDKICLKNLAGVDSNGKKIMMTNKLEPNMIDLVFKKY